MSSERDEEIPWVLKHCTRFPALDVGCAESTYIADLNGQVDGIDIRFQPPSGLRDLYVADIRTWLAPKRYPTVLAISTVEHVGLGHVPYGTAADDLHGDRRAVEGCLRALTPDGTLLLTVPFGTATDFGWYRQYDEQSLGNLLEGTRWTAEYHTDTAWPVEGVALCIVTR